LEDRRNVGESSYNSGDGTGRRVQSLMFMMMMTSILHAQTTRIFWYECALSGRRFVHSLHSRIIFV